MKHAEHRSWTASDSLLGPQLNKCATILQTVVVSLLVVNLHALLDLVGRPQLLRTTGCSPFCKLIELSSCIGTPAPRFAWAAAC